MSDRVPPRSISKTRRQLTPEEIEEGIELTLEYDGSERPKTRGECIQGIRPCPFVSCRHHLFLEFKATKHGQIRINFPNLIGPEEMEESCSLDIADSNPDGMTLEVIGQKMNLTRERVRQLEERYMEKIRYLAKTDPAVKELVSVWEASIERTATAGEDKSILY